MTVGTATQHFDEYRASIINITGITAAGTTPTIRSRSLVAGSFVVSGTWATSTSTTVQLQGSNDNLNFIALGVALTAASGGTTPQGAAISPDDFYFSFYNWVITGGDAGTSFAINARLTSPAG